jgi:hypothetical protein
MIYTEHEKLQKIQEKSQAIGDFYHWCLNKCYLHSFLKNKKLEDVLAEYFDINLERLDYEKKIMLDNLKKDELK